MKAETLGGSFRDPAGFVFSENGSIRRAVTQFGKPDYDRLLDTGLYEELVRQGWLVGHRELDASAGDLYKIIEPTPIPVITYPYEWCFSQLKDAALLTLNIQLTALRFGMSLKDATPFNVQFLQGAPVLIDTLSFTQWRERPWFGYRQFCETFLAPLAMMAEIKPDFNKYLSVDLNGTDLAFCSRSLPFRTWFHFGCLAHIHLHALSQSRFDNQSAQPEGGGSFKTLRFSKNRLLSLVHSLLGYVKKLRLKKRKTAFAGYYQNCRHYSAGADQFKAAQVERWVREISPRVALDIGGNDGKYSRLLTQKGILTVCADSDPYCVEENYRLSKKNHDGRMLPIVMDLSNPPPDLGWDGDERAAFFKRLRPDLVLALALIHHLRIGNNVPMQMLSGFFSKASPYLILEFVPKGDPMVRKLLANRDDHFDDYSQDNFESCFGARFSVCEKIGIPDTRRTLYFMKRK